jgi:hypothetical protein
MCLSAKSLLQLAGDGTPSANAARMVKTSKIPLVMILALLPLLGRGAVYVEPRLSVAYVPDAPEIGDVGRVLDHDKSHFAPGLAVGWTVTPRVALEVRYTRVGEFSALKESVNFQIFPSDPLLPLLPVLRRYRVNQESNLFSLAVPLTLVHAGPVKFSVTPIALYEDTHTVAVDVSPNIQTLLTVANLKLVDRHDRGIRPAVELAAKVALNPRTEAGLHYTYAGLANYDAHFLGAGLTVRF